MEIDSALHELYKLQSFSSNQIDYVEEKIPKNFNLDNKAQPPCGTSTSTMELDTALHKLGMLSSVTDSRLGYLAEKHKKKRSSHSVSSAPLCVVQMNPNFIKKFSVSKHVCASVESESEDSASNEKMNRIMRRHIRLSQNLPYHKRRRLKISKPEVIEYVLPPEKASPPSVSRQDSGNKSNPSSPVKSQSSLTSQGSSITRSRSLDDLETIECPPDCCCPFATVRTDIDTVSQSISQLHVS